MHKGDARIVVLDALAKRPMHGYEVMREISDTFGGMYAPSAGMVYPTLQWLEDESLLGSSVEGGGKKVYKITEAGRKFLASGEKTVKRLKAFQERFPRERVEMVRAGRNLMRTAMSALPDITAEDARKATKIINEAQSKLEELAGEGA